MDMGALAILLVDDHALFRRGVGLLMGEANPGARISEADSIEQALMLPEAAFDVVLLDIKLPGLSGFEGVSRLKERWPACKIVMLSALKGTEVQAEALNWGAAAFVSKAESPERILEAISTTLGQGMGGEVPVDANDHLTPRQLEVLTWLCQGLSNKLIARQLALSENTVRRHVQDILEYFQVGSRSQAIFLARRRGLIE